MQNYKDLKVWQKAHQITLKVYEITKDFFKEEIYSLTTQLRRAASSNEAEYFQILSKDLDYVDENIFNSLFLIINEIKAMLISFIGKVRKT